MTMRKVGNPIPTKAALVSVVMAVVLIRGLDMVWPSVSTPIGVPDQDDTSLAKPSKPTLVLDSSRTKVNFITIEENDLENVRFFEVYGRRLDDRFGVEHWSRWNLEFVVGKNIYGTWIFVDEFVTGGFLYEYKARAVDVNGNQIGTWSQVLSRRMGGGDDR